jgi:hypothetical protein
MDKQILQEARISFSQMSGCKIATFITTKDFQEYWQWVDEQTSSSFSGATFLHYKAASFHYMLSAMHATYLTACARQGIPLARWGIGLTVLLEKIIGNNFVHKLWAICLLEADFNWLNKNHLCKTNDWIGFGEQFDTRQVLFKEREQLHHCSYDKNIYLR